MRQTESMKKAETGRTFWDGRKKSLLGKGIFLLALLVIGMFLSAWGEPQADTLYGWMNLLFDLGQILLTIAIGFFIVWLIAE